MAIEVFNRYEDKYIITEKEFEKILPVIEAHMHRDKYNEDNEFYPIHNIYYDTANFRLIRNSLMKPKYKEKLRLRSYGRVEEGATVFLEIKKKYRGLVNKRRTKIKITDADNFIKYGEIPTCLDYMNPQVLKELEFFVNYYDLEPKVMITYDRLAYFDDGDLRISFDKNIRGRRTNLELTRDSGGEWILEEGLYLMEIKTKFAKPLWLTDMLTSEKILRRSFSKYGTYYKMLLKNEKIS